MLTLNHFIWLGIIAIIIIALFIINKKFNLTFDHNLTIMVVMAILSETTKILTGTNYEVTQIVNNKEVTYTYLDPINLPLHLCSIQIFFIFALKFIIKNETTKDKLLAFMCPTMLIGGLFAIFIPTEGVSFSVPRVYEFFLFHGLIIYFALYLIVTKKITITWRTYFRNICFLLILTVISLWLNSILADKAVNFFFLARPPMDDLFILNLNHGWLVYFFTLIAIGITVMTMFHLPFIIHNYRQKKALSS